METKKRYNLKEVMSQPERLAPGHRMCAGCGGTIAVRAVLRAFPHLGQVRGILISSRAF